MQNFYNTMFLIILYYHTNVGIVLPHKCWDCISTQMLGYHLLYYHTSLWYRSNVTSHSLTCIFLESQYSILFSRQVLAQILRELSEGSSLMLRIRLGELDCLREFHFVAQVINSSSSLVPTVCMISGL